MTTTPISGGSWSIVGHIGDTLVAGNFTTAANGSDVPNLNPPTTGNSWESGGAYIAHCRWTLSADVDLSATPYVAFDLWVDNTTDISFNVSDIAFSSVAGIYIANTIPSRGADLFPQDWTLTDVTDWRVLHCPTGLTHFVIDLATLGANLSQIGIIDLSIDCGALLPENIKIHNLEVLADSGGGSGGGGGSTDPNAAKILIQYYNGGWVTLPNAQLDHVMEELDGAEEFVFNVVNTAANRTALHLTVADTTNVLVKISYAGTSVFIGVLTAAVANAINLQCTAYNAAFLALKQSTVVFNATYTTQNASVILDDIIAAVGGTVSAGSCPSSDVSITFSDMNAFDAVALLAKTLNKDYYGTVTDFDTQASIISILTRDASTWTPLFFVIDTSRGIDRSKKIGKVVINGFDTTGTKISGSAGSSGAIKTLTNHQATDVSTLNTLAAYELAALNNPSTGSPLSLLTDTAYQWKPGQQVSMMFMTDVLMGLTGTYKIMRITKGSLTTSVEVEVALSQSDVLLQNTIDQLVAEANDYYNIANV
jgi:hypothetical protein